MQTQQITSKNNDICITDKKTVGAIFCDS